MTASMEKMNPVKHESENKMMPTEQRIDSSAIDEGSSGTPLAVGGILKKGPWTSAEDAILVDYVKKNGEGNWNAVQKHSGLSRCGKSCRLRWANHLRPNLKKGAITPEEENLIIELHAQMGNKWARMATFLPGRTDNEIKNYWNTRIKRRHRAGLPLYPPDLDGSNENLQSQGANEFSNINNHHNEILQGNTYNSFPDIIFDNYKADQGTLSYLPPFPDGYASRMLTQGFGSKSFDFAGNRIKRLRESETFLPGFHSAPPGGVLTFEQFSTGPPEKIQRGFGLAYPYDPDPSIKNLAPYGGAIPGSHALSNGNLSTSRPVPEKLELPSLQYTEMDLTSWTCPSSPLEAADSYIQSPPATLSVPSECVSPWNSGLLQDMVHGPHAIGSMKHQMSEKSSNSSILMPNNMVENSALNHGEANWGEHNDPVSPLGLNADSIFSDTPPISVGSLDEFPPSKVTSGQIMANVEHVSTPSVGELDSPTRPDFLRHDVFLGSDWLDESSQGTKERSMFNDALTTFLRDDLCSEYKDMPPGAAVASSGTQGLKLESCSWNNMPRVCQMSEIP